MRIPRPHPLERQSVNQRLVKMVGRVMKTNCLRIVCVQSGILVDNVTLPSDLKLAWYVGYSLVDN